MINKLFTMVYNLFTTVYDLFTVHKIRKEIKKKKTHVDKLNKKQI